MTTRINAFRPFDGHILCDFGEGPILEGETLEDAAIRIYRDWCLGTPGDTVEPDPSPLVVCHDD
jgi:hypothetical protein